MGRHLEHKHSNVQFEDHHPGCMWGILHMLDYHHWHSVKKMLPHKKHRGGRRVKCCGTPKTISFDHYAGEMEEYIDAESVPFLVEQQTTETSTTSNKGSPQCHIKSSIGKEIGRGENHKHWFLGFPMQSRLQKTESIHHLESSDDHPDAINSPWPNPIIILHKSADTSVNQNHLDAKQAKRDIASQQLSEHEDVPEMFKVNKELYLKILQDSDVHTAKPFNGKRILNKKARLAKSGSFPAADSSHIKFAPNSSLKHKQNEIWSFPKGEKLLTDSQAPKLSASKSLQDYYVNPLPSVSDDNAESGIEKETSLSSLGSSQVLKSQGWNHMFINRFKGMKHKISHALKDSKKESNHTSMDRILVSVPYECRGSTDGKEISERPKEITMCQDATENFKRHEVDISDDDISKSRFQCVRRVSSLDESMDRYTRLFENSFSGKTTLPHSRSLKLGNEDNVPSSGNIIKSFRRRLSLSDLEYFVSVNEVFHDDFRSGTLTRTFMDCDINAERHGQGDSKSGSIPVATDISEPLDAIVEAESVGKGKTEKSDLEDENIENLSGLIVSKNGGGGAKMGELSSEDIIKPTQAESRTLKVEQFYSQIDSSEELAQPSSIVDTTDLPTSQGSEMNLGHIQVDEPESSVNSLDMSSRVNHEHDAKVNNIADNHLLQFEVDKTYDADFNYVRDVLELSGFIEHGYLGTWHSIEQPLNPSLFKELEAYLHNELENSSEEVGSCNCDHQLLFDLINEALLDIFDRSFTYFPKTFSSSRQICPMPTGQHILDDVWGRISRHLSLKFEVDESLDDIVARDFTRTDGWMNLQLETEDVALDLEELIFEEILHEIVCSSYS